ncbi:type II secretion system minor pseudopilin GspJ [Salinimonas lutimaris]|uniref:type II secretion system minor pseudopilin GspJ n=1 Tax=Salinimonas lutimaris TaxID=914153 RepID=UPI0010C0BC7E|nr:type II secretion system minor pseudopilin GspJ [Salinimonas lutimaris]
MQQRGFTLLEILIAMAIFALIGLASTGVLTSVIDSNEISEQRFDRLQALQRAMLTIERDLLQAIERPIRRDGQQTQVVMAGGQTDDSDADGIGFVRGGWQNPQMLLPRSTQQMVAYRLRDNTLERVYTNYVDNVIGYEPKVRPLLPEVSDLNIEFLVDTDEEDSSAFSLSEDEGSSASWNESYQGAVLPKAVAIEIETRDFGRIRREFTLRGEGL